MNNKNSKNFIDECEFCLQDMKDISANDRVITPELIAGYENNLDKLRLNAEKFDKILEKTYTDKEKNSPPLNVALYFVGFSLVYGAIFGAFFGLGSSFALGGSTIEMWSPTLKWIAGAVGFTTTAIPFAIKETNLQKYYKSGKFEKKKISITKFLRNLSRKRGFKNELSQANALMLTTEELRKDYVNRLLSTTSLTREDLLFLPKRKIKKATKIIYKVDSIRKNLQQANKLITSRKEQITRNFENDELRINTELSTRISVENQGENVQSKSRKTNLTPDSLTQVIENFKPEEKNRNTPTTNEVPSLDNFTFIKRNVSPAAKDKNCQQPRKKR